MSLQPIHLPDYPHVRIIGDVHIDPTAAIAPGTILHAAPGCQIILSGGVCLGMGVIIKAYGGQIQLDEGVSLGPGVLIMGPSHLGSNACIGGMSTLWHTTIEALAVIPAGTVVGDPTRQVNLLQIDSERPQTKKLDTVHQPSTHPEEALEPMTPAPSLQTMTIADPWEAP
ncbi:MAG: carbon dioxide concentrating mechanism protein, partial [Spirulina sp. SIO3F2]|nr:carbon dioxide concentrating mechanism protein [Spirulina sp. SIO3F2]